MSRTQIPGQQILDQSVDTPDLKDRAVTDAKLALTGVSANTYTQVTVNAEGRVTDGANPTTLSGYGITDALSTSFPLISATNISTSYPNSRYLRGTLNQIVSTDNGAGSSIDISLASNVIFPGTGALTLTKGGTADRPLVAVDGMLRFNTDTIAYEVPISSVWKNIVLDDDPRLRQIARRVAVVSDNPGPGEFTSIAAACAAITTATATDQWLVEVSPGTYVETQINVPSYVHVAGHSEYEVTVKPDNGSHPLWVMATASTVSFLTVDSVLGTNQVAFQLHDTGDYGVLLHKVSVSNTNYAWDIKSIATNTAVYLEYCDTTADSSGGIGLRAESTNGFSVYLNAENFYVYGDGSHNYAQGIQLLGVGTKANIQAFGFEGTGGVGEAICLRDGARVDAKAGSISGWDVGVHLENTGAASTGNFLGVAFHDNTTWDLHAEHVGSLGTLNGTATRTKINASAAPGFTSAFNDIENNEYVQTGGFFMGETQAALTNVSELILDSGPVGVLNGGALSAHPTLSATVVVAPGYGYLMDPGTQQLKFIQWGSTNVTLVDNSPNTIWIDTDNVFHATSSDPDSYANIILGGAMSFSGNVAFIGRVAFKSDNVATHLDEYLRTVFGPIFSSGSFVTESATPLQLDVSSGVYYLSRIRFAPSGGTSISFLEFQPDGTFRVTNTVNNTQYNNAGTLTAIPNHKFVKHALYLFEDGSDETYGFVFGQQVFNSIQDAQNGPLPVPPSFFVSPVVIIASLIIDEDNNTHIAQILDERPRLGFTAASTSLVSDHGNLTGLLDDDHPQYLLVNGTRAMLGNLNMGGYSVTNVNLVDGVDVNNHGMQHDPNGTDPVSTAAAISLSPSSVNTVGLANSLARSDHTHLVTGFQPTLKLFAENPVVPAVATVTGNNAVAIGYGATAQADESLAVGDQSLTRHSGSMVISHGRFGSQGDAQSGKYLLRTTTVNASATELFIDGTAGSERLTLPSDSTWTFEVTVVGHQTDGDGHAGFKFKGVIYKIGSVNTYMLGAATKETLSAHPNWNAAVAADNTNGSLKISVTGETSKTIRWFAVVDTTEVTN